ncbi:MAG: ABC transporter ATP-binding protein [bacterium]
MRTGAWALWAALPRTRPYLRPYRRTLYLVIGLTVLVAVLGLAEPWPLALILNSVLGDNPPGALLEPIFGTDPGFWTLLIFAVSLRFLVIAVGNAFTVLTNYFGSRMEQEMVLDLRSDLFRHTQRLSLTFHDHRQTGALMSQINLQAAALGNIVMALPPILEAMLTLVGMLVIAVLIDWQLAVLSLAVVPFLFWSFGAYGNRIVPRLQRVQKLEWRSLSIVHEAMAMLRVIVSFGREDHEHRRFRDQGKVAVDERVKLTVGQSLYTLGVQTVTAAGTSLVLGVGVWHVTQGILTIGELIVLMSYIASVYQPLEQVSTTIGSLHAQLVQFDASLRLLDTEPEVKEAEDAIELGRAEGRVAAEGVSFSYSGREGTLSGVSFEAEPGERIAIVGPTGAGKTTLMSLLTRFYDPHSGRITIDGVDVRRLKLSSLREQISVVLQEPLLFSGTIEENILYGKLDGSHEQVVEATKAANAHDFVSRLPDGYETQLGERGAQLSGGERQRICVARAFLKDAPILVLDEPTSSIDSRTENVILDALDDLMEGRTSFMVAHRLSTVRHADQILVVDHGRIIERGTHEGLLDQDGLYAQLYEAQGRERQHRQKARRTAALAGVAVSDIEALPDGAATGEPQAGPAEGNGPPPPGGVPGAAVGGGNGGGGRGGRVTWRQLRPSPPKQPDERGAGR